MSDKKTKDGSITIEDGVGAFQKVSDVSGAVASLDPVGGKIFKFRGGILNIAQLAVSDNRAKTSLKIGLGTAVGAAAGAGVAFVLGPGLAAVGASIAFGWLVSELAGGAYDKSETVKKVTDAAYNTVVNAGIKTTNTVLGTDFNTLKDQNTQDQKTLETQNNSGGDGGNDDNGGGGDDVLKTCCTKTYEWEYIRRVA